MVERARSRATPAPVLGRDQLRMQLSIDREALDDCLTEQPDLYYHTAEGYALAVARRDAAKLDLEQVTAELDEQYRRQAADNEEKLTEAAMTRKLAATPRLQSLEASLLQLRSEVDRWQALKEAFQQRSFMLRELVQMLVSRLSTIHLERSVDGAHRDLADANRAAAGELRHSKRAGL